jgi:hypothetical protein
MMVGSLKVQGSNIRSRPLSKELKKERKRIITLLKKVDDGGCPYDLCSGSPGEEVGNCRECLIDWLQKSLRGTHGRDTTNDDENVDYRGYP